MKQMIAKSFESDRELFCVTFATPTTLRQQFRVFRFRRFRYFLRCAPADVSEKRSWLD